MRIPLVTDHLMFVLATDAFTTSMPDRCRTYFASYFVRVFDNGPRDCGGPRYCMNSVSLTLEEK